MSNKTNKKLTWSYSVQQNGLIRNLKNSIDVLKEIAIWTNDYLIPWICNNLVQKIIIIIITILLKGRTRLCDEWMKVSP